MKQLIPQKIRPHSSDLSTRLSSSNARRRPMCSEDQRYYCQSGKTELINNQFESTQNWTDEHILKYRSYLRDIRNLSTQWGREVKYQKNNLKIEQTFDLFVNKDFDLEENITATRKRPCSSIQKQYLTQVNRSITYQRCNIRQKKLKELLQNDSNYINRSFRCTTTIQGLSLSMKND